MPHITFNKVQKERENYQTYNTAIYNAVFKTFLLHIQNQILSQAKHFKAKSYSSVNSCITISQI